MAVAQSLCGDSLVVALVDASFGVAFFKSTPNVPAKALCTPPWDLYWFLVG